MISHASCAFRVRCTRECCLSCCRRGAVSVGINITDHDQDNNLLFLGTERHHTCPILHRRTPDGLLCLWHLEELENKSVWPFMIHTASKGSRK